MSPDILAGVLPDPVDRPRLSRDARILLGGVAVDALGTGLVLPFLVVYLHDVRGIALGAVGILAAVPAAVALVLLGPLGVVIDRVGPRRVQVMALACSCAGAFVLATAAGVGGALIAQLLVGVGYAAFWPANQSLVALLVGPAARQHYFGLSFTLLNAGIGLGGLTSGLLVSVENPDSFRWIYLGDGLTFLVPMAILLGPLRHVGGAGSSRLGALPHAPASRPSGMTSRPSGTARPPSTTGYRAVLADRVFRRVLAVSALASFVGYGQMQAGWTAFARTVARADPSTIGFAFAANTAVIVALQLVVLRLIQGRRRTRVLMVMAAIWALAWTIMGVAGLVPASTIAAVLLVASLAVFGAGETLLSPVSPALINDLAPDHLRGRYNAAAALAFQAAAIIGPTAAGLMLELGWDAEYVGTLLVGCAVLVALLLHLERVLPPWANGVRGAQPVSTVPVCPA